VRVRALEINEAPVAVLAAVLEGVSEHVATLLPCFRSARRKIRIHRQQVNRQEPLPRNLGELVFPQRLMVTQTGDRFLQVLDGDNNNKIAIFASEKCVDVLVACPVIYTWTAHLKHLRLCSNKSTQFMAVIM